MKLFFKLLMIFFFILPSLLFAASPWGKILICYPPSQSFEKYPIGGYFSPEIPSELSNASFYLRFKLMFIERYQDKYSIGRKEFWLKMNIEEIVLGEWDDRVFEEIYWLDRKTLQLTTLNPEVTYNCEILNYDHSSPKDMTDPFDRYNDLEGTINSTLEKRMQGEVDRFQLYYDLAREKKGNKL